MIAVWYYISVVRLRQKGGGGLMEYIVSFLISVVAGIVVYYIGKWLDGQ